MEKKEYYNKITKLNEKRSKTSDLNNEGLKQFLFDDIDYRVRELMENFVNEYLDELINCAREYCKPSYGDGVVFLTPEGEIVGATLSTNTRQNPDNSNIEVYRLSKNGFDRNGVVSYKDILV